MDRPGQHHQVAVGADLQTFGARIDGAHMSLNVCCLIEPVLDPNAVVCVEPTCVFNPVARSGQSLEKCAVLRGRCGLED
jgi:hypothetical protein